MPVVFLATLIFALLGGLFWWSKVVTPPVDDDTRVSFLIPRGRSASQIANSLYEGGFIRSPLAFKYYVQMTGKAKSIQAGEFGLSKNLNLYQVVEKLSSGPLELWVTIPEGLRREEIVERFIAGLEMDNAQAKIFREEFIDATETMEGYLFPDTYLFPREASASAVINKMRSTFDLKLADFEEELERSNYSLSEVVTVASIVERETKTDEERPIVAGILYKRLEADWPLQADASVQYAAGNLRCRGIENCNGWWPILTKEDLEIDSQYNSYKFEGLPPSPISNPGVSSLSSLKLFGNRAPE